MGSKPCFLLTEQCLRGHKASLLEGSAQTGQDTRGLFISRDLSSQEHGTLPEKLWVRSNYPHEGLDDKFFYDQGENLYI